MKENENPGVAENEDWMKKSRDKNEKFLVLSFWNNATFNISK